MNVAGIRRAVGPAVLALCLAACGGAHGGSAAPNRATGTGSPQAAHPSTVACSPTHRRDVTVTVGGERRRFLVAVPRRTTAAALLVVYHGFGETARWIDRYTRLPAEGVRHGFVVATPMGLDDRWNFPRRASVGPDDVAFFDAMLRWLVARACVDPHAVFLTGFSDGADMADTVVCARPGLVRAVATVAASVIPRPCRGPVDVLAIHGDADPVVPFEGGGAERPPPFQDSDPVSAAAQLRAWERLDGCRSTRSLTFAAVVRLRGVGCRGGHVVELLVVRGGGHTWPGATASLPYGRTVRTMSATYLLLYFFEHLRDG